MVPWPNVAVTDVSDSSVAANGSVSMWSPSLPSLPTALRLVKGISTQRGSPTAPFVFTMCLCFTAVWTVSASQRIHSSSSRRAHVASRRFNSLLIVAVCPCLSSCSLQLALVFVVCSSRGLSSMWCDSRRKLEEPDKVDARPAVTTRSRCNSRRRSLTFGVVPRLSSRESRESRDIECGSLLPSIDELMPGWASGDAR